MSIDPLNSLRELIASPLTRNRNTETSQPLPQLLTLLELATALRVSTHTVRAWVRKGKLRPIRLCRRLLFHPHEVDRFLSDAK
jgi:excisionase family DNA binding protein